MRRPYRDKFQTTNATLYQGDALEVLLHLVNQRTVIGSMVIDPPYCSGGFTETARRAARGQGLRSEVLRKIGWFQNDDMTTAGIVWLLRSTAVLAAEMRAAGGSLCVFTDWRMADKLTGPLESSGLRYQNLVTWDKGTPGLGNGFRPQHELILHFVKGRGRYNHRGTGNVLSVPRVHPTRKRHQTEKPVDLVERILRVVALPSLPVVDCFAGSGSTAEACQRLGLPFIGVEKDREIFRTACRRIAETQKQSRAKAG